MGVKGNFQDVHGVLGGSRGVSVGFGKFPDFQVSFRRISETFQLVCEGFIEVPGAIGSLTGFLVSFKTYFKTYQRSALVIGWFCM